MSERQHVVQVEFFLVNTSPTKSLAEVEKEAWARAKDEAHIKECVRFYDGGTIADLVKRAQQAHKLSGELLRKYGSAGYLRRALIGSSRRHQEAVCKKLREHARRLCVQRIEALARTTQELAVEREGHRFRMVTPNELHELVESIKKSNGVWFFVFAPNTLISETNTVQASSL